MKRREINWPVLREEWLSQNLVERPRPYALADLARAHGVPPQTVRVRAMREDWTGQLAERRAARSGQVRAALSPADVFSEIDVRVRQATHARLAQDIAVRRLSRLTDAEVAALPIRTVVELLRVGLVEERTAIALPDRVVAPLPELELPTVGVKLEWARQHLLGVLERAIAGEEAKLPEEQRSGDPAARRDAVQARLWQVTRKYDPLAPLREQTAREAK